MPSDSSNLLARRDTYPIVYARVRFESDEFPRGVFCVSPTVLEAINHMLAARGFPTFWVAADGTIGPTEPLLLTVECEPNPFLN